MDDQTVIEEKNLPIRNYRKKKVNADKDAYVEKDPLIIGWKMIKQEKWSCSRRVRNDAL